MDQRSKQGKIKKLVEIAELNQEKRLDSLKVENLINTLGEDDIGCLVKEIPQFLKLVKPVTEERLSHKQRILLLKGMPTIIQVLFYAIKQYNN